MAQRQQRRLSEGPGGGQLGVQLLVAAMAGLQIDRARDQPLRHQPGQVPVAAHPPGQVARRGGAVALPFAQHPVDQPDLLRRRQPAEVAVAPQRLRRGLGTVVHPEAQRVVLDLVPDPFVDLPRPLRRDRLVRLRPADRRGECRLFPTAELRRPHSLSTTQRRQAHAVPLPEGIAPGTRSIG
ncbi:hypothetical protein [Inquilinus limosus]|uniref:hypothetical protein n=1 Tax=Inquilinus limosus TaxID=171674 RepID=UPI0012DD8D6E|nr:hypothetical protein [Inquilinus limosus]